MRESCAAKRPAFSLIELLVVLAILSILMGLLLSAVQKVRASAARALCASRLRQIALALHGCHDTQGALPPGSTRDIDGGKHRSMSWHVRILPWIEQEALFTQAINAFAVQPNFSLPPHPVGVVVPTYECPSDPRSGRPGKFANSERGLTSFLGVSGTEYTRPNGVLFADSRIRFGDITDGTSNTLLVGERPPSASLAFGWWYAGVGQNGGTGSADMILGVREYCFSATAPDCLPGPYEFGSGNLRNECDAFHFWSLHSGGAHFAFSDGSVRFLSYGAKDVLPALATRAGGEAVEVP